MIKKLLIICACAVLLTGCTKSYYGGSRLQPEFETKAGIVLDWGQIGEDLDELFTENDDYPMGVSVNYSIDQENKVVNLTLMVKEGTSPEDAVIYADAVVRGLNDEAAVQDFNYETSTDDSYGGFLKEYSVKLIVMPDGAMENQDQWLVDMEIPAGSDEKIVPVEK